MLVPFAVVERSVAELVGETDVEAFSAERVVETILEALHPNVALACSFQKEESVLLDMLLEREPAARVFALDTHVLFPETYAVWREIERRYGVAIQVYEGPSLGRQAAIHGEALWEPRRRPLRPRRLDHRRPPRSVADALRDAEARLGRTARDLEGEPARRLDGRRRLGLRPGARPPGQRAPRARIRLDRLHALHGARDRP